MIICFFENKNKAFLRHITVNALIIKNNKILLAKRGKFNKKPILEYGKWALIGGFLGRDENLVQGIKREVMEESGWEINNIKIFRINDNPNRPKEDRQNIDIIFIASPVKKIKKSDEEVSYLKWFNLNKLPEKESFAFDHLDSIELYKKYLKKKFNIPIIG